MEYYTRLLGVESLIAGSTSKRAGSDPRFTLVAGDTPYDILAAHRCALPIVAVLSGGVERERLAKAEFIFDNARDILERIDEIDAWFE